MEQAKHDNRLTLINPRFAQRITNRAHIGLYQCECGNTVLVRNYSVKSGNTKSCGCLSTDTTQARSEAVARHGHSSFRGNKSGSPTYKSWQSMKNRVLNKNVHNYHNYGGRGIKICQEWMIFDNFLKDMGLRPGKGFTLDRIDNDGNYEPSNCRWATGSEQRKNQRRGPSKKTKDIS